jgi:lysophospholipase L1-like esterase
MAGPELMAIGDSLFNGVRSLTIDPALASWSAPAQLAKALGANLAVPDYPRNVVINFEKWLTEIVDIPGVLNDLSSNIAFWNTQPKSALPQFDNIAIASTTWSDMCTRTWQTAQAEIEQINHLVAAGQTTYNDNLGALFFAFNTRFILNPTGNPNTPAQTSMDIVAERKPTRLIVSIGANDGLWQMAFSSFACPGFNQANGVYGPAQVAALQTFLTALRNLPPEVQHIYVNTLPLPSTVPNMMPVDDDFTNKPGPQGFYPKYENRFGFNYGQLTDVQIGANNKVMADLQVFMNGLVDPNRIHFVPIDKMLLTHDFKTNAAGQEIAIPLPNVDPLSNMMIDAGTDITTLTDYWDGGFAGLDGMHPTFVGYNLMAQTILSTIVASEPGFQPPGALPTVAQAYAADTLLNHLPDDWTDLMYAWRDFRQLFHVGAAPPTPSIVGGRMQSLMKLVQFKTT